MNADPSVPGRPEAGPSSPGGDRFGSILRGEAKEALVFSGANILNKLGGLLLLPLYLKLLSPEDYGVLALIGVIAVVQALAGTLCMDLGITRFYYEWPEADRRRNLGALWTWNWICIAIACGAFLAGMPLAAPLLFPGIPYYPLVFLGICANALSSLFLIPMTTLRIQRRSWLFAGYSFASFLVNAGLGILFVLVLRRGLEGYLTASILANALFALAGGAFMLAVSRPALASPGLRAAIRLSLPVIPSNALSAVASGLDRILLNRFASLEVLGIYSVSMKFAEIINGLHGSLKMAYGPFLMKTIAKGGDTGKAVIRRMTPFYASAYFAVGLGICLFIREFVLLIDRPQYAGVAEWVPLLVGLSILTCLYFYYTHGMILGNRTDLLWIPATVNIVAITALSLLLIKPLQLWGVVISRYASAILFFAVNLHLSRKSFDLPQDWGRLVAMAGLAIGLAAAGTALEPLGPALRLPLKAALMAAFAYIGWFRILGAPGASLPGLPFLARLRGRP